MNVSYRRASFLAAAGALMGLAACGKQSTPMDDSLKSDLAAVGGTAPTSGNGIELAPTSANSQMVVSAIEAGPTSAPAPAVKQIVPRPSPKPAERIASIRNLPVEAPTPAPAQHVFQAPTTVTEPMPARAAAPLPAGKAAEPPPLPPAASNAQGRQAGVYKTEAQVFRQMPWIKP